MNETGVPMEDGPADDPGFCEAFRREFLALKWHVTDLARGMEALPAGDHAYLLRHLANIRRVAQELTARMEALLLAPPATWSMEDLKAAAAGFRERLLRTVSNLEGKTRGIAGA